MTTETKWLGVILIITVVLLFGGVFLLSRGQSSKAIEGTNVSQIDYSYFKALENPEIRKMNQRNRKNLINPFFAGAFPITLDYEFALTVRGENAGAYPNTLYGVVGQLESPKQSLQDFLADELSDILFMIIRISNYYKIDLEKSHLNELKIAKEWFESNKNISGKIIKKTGGVL